jgi:hypothetical protein
MPITPKTGSLFHADAHSQFGARTRYEVAVAIATRVAAFERFLPPPRKLWMSEDARMGIFRAAALALTYYDLRGKAHAASLRSDPLFRG